MRFFKLTILALSALVTASVLVSRAIEAAEQQQGIEGYLR